MQVLDQDDGRFATALRLDQPPHEPEELALPRLGVHARDASLGVGDAEKIEEERQGAGELRLEQQDGPGDLPAGGVVAVLLPDAEVAAQQLEHGQEGNHLPVRDTVGLVDGEPPSPGARRELEAEPALADAGLGHDVDHAAAPRHRALEGGVERRGLLVAADEARKAPRP